MTDLRPDDEQLSALIEGRLQGRQRDELLAQLADDDDEYQLFVDSADVFHELQEEDARAEASARQTTPPPSMRTAASGWRRRLVIPVVLTVLALLGVFALRGRGSMASPVQLAAQVDADAGSLSPGRWFATRGAGDEAGREVRAAQAGALLVQLSVAVEAADAAQTQLLATRVRTAFDPQAVEASPIAQLARRAGEPPALLRPLVEQAAERLEERLGRDPLRLGAWTEAAVLAAQRRDDAFFRSGATRTALRRAERLTQDDPEARQALSAIKAALDASASPEWTALQGSLDALVAALIR